MCYSVIILLVCFLCSPCLAATLLYTQTFESTGWESDFTGSGTWDGHIARTTSNPHGGSYSLRGNLNPSVTDAITGLTGLSSMELDYRGSGGSTGIETNTPNGVFFRFWIRYDSPQWTGSMDGDGKLFYIIDQVHNICGPYIGYQGIKSTNFGIQYVNGTCYSDEWARTNWGYDEVLMDNASFTSSLADATWHKIELYMNYTEHYYQLWLDSNILLPQHATYRSNFADWATGKTYYDSSLTLKARGFQLLYVNAAQVDGGSAGWQIDDIEVWDGIPDSTSPTISGCTISGGSIR